MTKSLAELRAAKPEALIERPIELFLAPALDAEVRALSAEHDRLTATPGDDEDGRPRRLGGDVNTKQAKELRARIDSLLKEGAEYQGVLTVRNNLTEGEWRRWANEHPSRDEGEPGYERDQRVTAGFCNADDLLDTLGQFVHAWNGEPLTDEDWAEVFEPVIGTASKGDIASLVVGMYESRLDFQGLRSTLSPILKRLNDASSPANSASPTSVSTAGSPDGSPAATTTPATA